ncbi:MAG: hypothetical protein RSC29_05050, partial [Oscillospiraceae bacterium]
MSTKHVEQPMENSQDVEQYLTTYSQNRNHPFKIILSFFKGKIPDLIKSVFIIICKILPVWMLPIVTSNIIN